MTKSMVPYSFQTDRFPVDQPIRLNEGERHGVHLTFQAERHDWLLAKLRSWFADRDEIILVGHGTTEKTGMGFILLEWDGFRIDQLFLAILDEEALIEDYSLYVTN